MSAPDQPQTSHTDPPQQGDLIKEMGSVIEKAIAKLQARNQRSLYFEYS